MSKDFGGIERKKRTANNFRAALRSALGICFQPLRRLPKFFQTLERRLGQGGTRRLDFFLHIMEAPPKSRTCFSERLFRIHFQESRDVDERKQQIADLVLYMFFVRRLAGARFP